MSDELIDGPCTTWAQAPSGLNFVGNEILEGVVGRFVRYTRAPQMENRSAVI